MEDSYAPETPSNKASSGSCTNELTRLNSGASSLTVANFNDTMLPSGNTTTVIVPFFRFCRRVYLCICLEIL